MIPPVPDERPYDPTEAVVFHKTREQWGELSNMAAGFPLVVSGAEWLTPEALYQACRFPQHPDVQRLILEQSSPRAAKTKSKLYGSRTRSDWESARTKIMRWVLRVKLVQNYERFSAVLHQTGVRPIVERSNSDSFWGAIPNEHGVLHGANALGRLLMELREEMRARRVDGFLAIDPPDLGDFLLLEKLVCTVRVGDQPNFPRRLL